MHLHEKQYFDFLLATAVERFVERLEQRNEGAENALPRLRDDPNGPGIWLDEYTDAIFRDFLLDNVAGACLVLSALSRRQAAATPPDRIENTLLLMAKRAFADLLHAKAEEILEQHIAYSSLPAPSAS